MIAVLALTLAALALTPEQVTCCQGLDADELARARALMAGHYPYDGCDDTVAACLASDPGPTARRMAGEICRRVASGASDDQIDQALRLRARSMMPGGPVASIDLAGVPSVGAPEAPVVLVEYACLRCPFCARITPVLVHEVTGGELKGKVRLYYKLFPIKGHEGSVEAGLAALAAHRQGRFWGFLDIAYRGFDAFSIDRIDPWAREAGLDMAAYANAVADPATREGLVATKREGMANGVAATPTFFISGRLYQAELEKAQILDVLLEEYERLTSR